MNLKIGFDKNARFKVRVEYAGEAGEQRKSRMNI